MTRYYSNSKIETFTQCPFKYKLCYVDKVKKPDKESIEAFMGKCVHSSLKKLYDEIKDRQVISLDNLIKFYSDLWDKSYSRKIFIVRKDRVPEDYKQTGIGFIENYYKRHMPFNEDITLQTEMRLSIPLKKSEDLIFTGIVDRVAQKDSNVIMIHDYKTSSHLPDEEEIKKDRQLAMYQIGVSERYPHAQKIELVWHFLAHNKSVGTSLDETSLSAVKKSVLGLISEIEATVEFEMVEGALCPWCEYLELCPVKNRRKEANYIQQEFLL